MLLLLALCGGGCECGPTPDAQTTVRFWHTFNAEETQTVESLVRDFERENPGVRVEVTVLPFGAARNRLRNALRGDDGPDLARAEIAWVPELATEGLVTPLQSDVDLGDHIPAARPVVEYDGTIWAFPQGVDCLVLYYNRDHLRQIDAAAPATLDDLSDVGRRLTLDAEGRALGTQGFDPARVVRHGLFLKGDGYYFLPFLWGYGGDTFVGPDRTVAIGTPASAEASRRFVDLVRQGIAPARVDFARDYAEELAAFGDGRVSMIVQGPWAAAEILRGGAFSSPDNLGVVPVPRGPGGRGGSPSGGHGFVVSARSTHAGVARSLGAFLSSESAQKRLALRNHILPTRVAVYAAPEVSRAPLLKAFHDGLEQAHSRAIFPGMAQMFDALTPAVQRLMRGEGEPAEVLGAVADEWTAISR